MDTAPHQPRSGPWQPENMSFNLQPQQPPRIRKGWERVPVKAAGATQQKDKKVWKRPEQKEFHYETMHGGAGFTINGAKRVRTQNVPALPVKKSVRRDRAEEAEAQDELFARRRKSARLSSLNLQNLQQQAPLTSPAQRRIEARRKMKTRDSLRSPLKDLRVMAMTHNAQNRKPRTSISSVLQNGTPMRKVFAERQGDPSKQPRPRVSIGGVLGSGTPMRMAFANQENVAPAEELKSAEDTELSPSYKSDSPLLRTEDQLNQAIDNITNNSPQPLPRRRSLRLSGGESTVSGGSAEHVSQEVHAGISHRQDMVQSNHSNNELEVESAQPAALDERPMEIYVGPTEEDLVNEQIALEIEAAESATTSPVPAAQPLRSEQADTTQVQPEAELPTLDDENVDEDEHIVTRKANEVTPDLPEHRDNGSVQDNVLTFMNTAIDSADELLADSSDAESEDELADNTVTKPFSFSFGPEGEDEASGSPRRRKAPRLSDDTSILKDFLSRAQAKRAADAQAAQLLSAKLGPSIQQSPRRSPRRAAASQPKPAPPSPLKRAAARANPGTPTKSAAPPYARDGDESDELCSPVKNTRRSARQPPGPTKLGIGAPSMIPLRRPNGQEPVKLKKTETQERARATYANTRRNKGPAKMPREVLEDLSKKEPSPIKSRGSKPGKAVDWQPELVSYLGPGRTQEKGRVAKGEKQKRTRGLGTVNGTPAKPKAPRLDGSGPAGSTPARRLRSTQA